MGRLSKTESTYPPTYSCVALCTMNHGQAKCINGRRYMPQHAPTTLRLELDASLEIQAPNLGP